MHRDITPAPSSETYSTHCQAIFSAHHRFWYTAGTGSLIHAPNPGIEQTLIDGRIDCVTAIEYLVASTDPLEWDEPTQPTAAEVRSFRHPFPPSIDERLKDQFGQEGYLPLCRFFLALRHLCRLFDTCKRAGIAVITDTKPVPANTFGYQINPVCTALSASTLNADSGDRLASHSVGCPNAPPPPRRYESIALSP